MPMPPARAARRAQALVGPVLVAALLAAVCSGGGSPATGAAGPPAVQQASPPAAGGVPEAAATTPSGSAGGTAAPGDVGTLAVDAPFADGASSPDAPPATAPTPSPDAAAPSTATSPARPLAEAAGPQPPEPPAAGSGSVPGRTPAEADPHGRAPGGAPADPDGPAQVVGAVLRAWAEPATGPGTDEEEPALLTYLDTGTDQVQVPSSSLAGVGGNAWVRAELGGPTPATGSDDPRQAAEGGREVLAVDVLAPGEPVDEVQAALPAPGAHEVTVAMVAPAGAVQDYTTLADVVAAVEVPVSQFWSEQTEQAVTFTVTTTQDWYTSATTCADATGMWNEAAARTGWTEGPGKHLLLYVTTATSMSSCYAGLGTVGSGTSSGGRAYVRGTGTSLIAHELGHNMGLGHSDGLVCSGGTDGAWSGSAWGNGCVERGYRDYYDVMGTSWPYLGTLTAQHATFLGALTGGRLEVTGPTRAVLAPASSLRGLRALKVVEGGATYWVEFRPRAGRDSWLDGGNYNSLSSGVLLRRTNPRSARASLLLDATPTGSASDWSAHLPTGPSFTTAGGRFSVTVEGVGSAGATVAVAVDGEDPTTTTGPEPEDPSTPLPPPAPTPGTALAVQSPSEGAVVDEGTVRFSGSGSAPEAALLWELRDSDGTLAQSGFALAGANGAAGTWTVDRIVPAGDWTFTVLVPDDSDGEGPAQPQVVRSISVR